jgi:hypothetical protein
MIAVYRWDLAVCPMVITFDRQTAVARPGFQSIAFFLQRISNRQTEYLPSSSDEIYVTFAKRIVLMDQKTQKIFADSGACADCRRCAVLGDDNGRPSGSD